MFRRKLQKERPNSIFVTIITPSYSCGFLIEMRPIFFSIPPSYVVCRFDVIISPSSSCVHHIHIHIEYVHYTAYIIIISFKTDRRRTMTGQQIRNWHRRPCWINLRRPVHVFMCTFVLGSAHSHRKYGTPSCLLNKTIHAQTKGRIKIKLITYLNYFLKF